MPNVNMDLKDLGNELRQGASEEPPESSIQEIIKAILKNQLAQEAKSSFRDSCKVLKIILQNIYKYPEEEKYRRIKLNNPKFNQLVAKYPSGLLVLELLGFLQIPDEEPILIYTFDTLDLLKEVVNIIEKLDFHIQKPEPTSAPFAFSKTNPAQKPNEIEAQLKEYRNKQKNKKKGPAKIITLSDLQKLDQNNHQQPPRPNLRTNQIYNSISSFKDPRNLMLRAHELSNQFRAKEGKLVLVWNEGLCEIACEHSKDMGDGKVPFGHQGFNKRFKRFPIYNVRGGAENVAYNNCDSDPGKVAVDGWISSPGHRKNLLGMFHFMAVGVYVNDQGLYYFTQLFASV